MGEKRGRKKNSKKLDAEPTLTQKGGVTMCPPLKKGDQKGERDNRTKEINGVTAGGSKKLGSKGQPNRNTRVENQKDKIKKKSRSNNSENTLNLGNTGTKKCVKPDTKKKHALRKTCKNQGGTQTLCKKKKGESRPKKRGG